MRIWNACTVSHVLIRQYLTHFLSVCCHLAVALNYQSARRPIFLNESKFRQNGGCGYILKPKFLCGDVDYDPDAVMDDR